MTDMKNYASAQAAYDKLSHEDFQPDDYDEEEDEEDEDEEKDDYDDYDDYDDGSAIDAYESRIYRD